MQTKIPHGNDRQGILVDPSGRQNFLHEKLRQEIPVDPPSKQNFPYGSDRQEIIVDPSGGQSFINKKFRQEIPVDPPRTQSSRHEVRERQRSTALGENKLRRSIRERVGVDDGS